MQPALRALVIALVLLVVAIPFSGTLLAAPAGGRLAVALGSTTTILDITLDFGVPVLNPAVHLYDFLVWRDETMKLQPMLATSWTYVNPTTLRFNLRKGVRFHNGDEMTSQDVLYTINRILNPSIRSQHRSFLAKVARVRAVDDSTVELQLRGPDAHLLTRLSRIPIVPKNHIETVGEERWQNNPIGTGPYKIRQWFKGQRLILEANGEYWGAKPKVGTLIYRTILDDRTRMAAVKTGDVDIAVNVPPIETAYLRQSPNVNLATTPSLRTLMLLFNTKKGGPLSDVRVRRALAHALDKELLVRSVLQNYGKNVALPWGPEGFGYNANVPTYDYDPERARALLREAGLPSDFTLTIVAPTGRYLAGNETALAVAGMWEKVGVKTSVKFLEFQFWLQNYIIKYSADMDVDMRGSANTTADPHHVLSTTFNSKLQGFYWHNAEVEELMNMAATSISEDERLRMYHRAGEIIATEIPAIPLWSFVDVYAVRKRVQGFKPRPDELVDLRGVSVR